MYFHDIEDPFPLKMHINNTFPTFQCCEETWVKPGEAICARINAPKDPVTGHCRENQGWNLEDLEKIYRTSISTSSIFIWDVTDQHSSRSQGCMRLLQNQEVSTRDMSVWKCGIPVYRYTPNSHVGIWIGQTFSLVMNREFLQRHLTLCTYPMHFLHLADIHDVSRPFERECKPLSSCSTGFPTHQETTTSH